MYIEDWAELIKNAFTSNPFKDLAVAALGAMYGCPVRLSDGPGDGGVDAWLHLPSGDVPAQFHSGRQVAWDVKLREDLETHEIIKKSGRLLFVCAQTPQETTRRRMIADLEGAHGVRIDMIDARELASQVRTPEVRAVLEKFAGTGTPPTKGSPVDRAMEARVAFVFFHEKSADFRAEVARSVLIACLVASEQPRVAGQIVEQAVALAGAGSVSRGAFHLELESLARQGLVVVGPKNEVSASVRLRELTSAARGLQVIAREQLSRDCEAALVARVHSEGGRRDAVADVLDDLGLLLRESFASALPGSSSEGLSRRMNAIERRLEDHLKPTGGNASAALSALVEVASSSDYGRALGAAELFTLLASREVGHLAAVLTRKDATDVWLDTSLAMPMLCGLLDRIAEGWATSEIAVALHGALRERNLRMVVPRVYVEEMAAHLIESAQRYRTLVGETDNDLARSTNFYVAHFHAASTSRGEPVTQARFDTFLSDFGLPEDWRDVGRSEADFLRVRRKIEISLRDSLRYYQIDVPLAGSVDAIALPGEPARSFIVLLHDRCVAKDLEEVSREEQGVVFCSEDRWLVQTLVQKELTALHPAMLLDVLQIVHPSGEPRRLATPRELAAMFSERVAQQAAEVWDLLAEMDGSRFEDRELLRRAKQFRREWLERGAAAERPRARDWSRFKAELSLEP